MSRRSAGNWPRHWDGPYRRQRVRSGRGHFVVENRGLLVLSSVQREPCSWYAACAR